ncbi:hypothetical protein FH972_026085 [Carpinus fangiana]|uniref:Lipoprotein n=1 Tax=Carpinus fangiana TaxID=176857 RepID=A0A5N6L3A3_9ROSI|nr:hypothetical protein FH972_026085 [Carpinus fangiana]
MAKEPRKMAVALSSWSEIMMVVSLGSLGGCVGMCSGWSARSPEFDVMYGYEMNRDE